MMFDRFDDAKLEKLVQDAMRCLHETHDNELAKLVKKALDEQYFRNVNRRRLEDGKTTRLRTD